MSSPLSPNKKAIKHDPEQLAPFIANQPFMETERTYQRSAMEGKLPAFVDPNLYPRPRPLLENASLKETNSSGET